MPEFSNADSPSQEPSPERKPMTDDEIQAELKKQIADAEDFIDTVVSPQRVKADEYYKGILAGDEAEPGRSNVVMTELRDVVAAIMPPIMRAFFGPERLVEFTPIGPEDVAQAEQETDYINDVVMSEDNPGFLNTYSWLKDGFVKTTGVVKWWWNDAISTTSHRVNNVSEEQMMLLLTEEGVKLVGVSPHTDTIEGQPASLFDIEFTRTAEDGRAQWMPLPPEEFGFSKEGRSLEEAQLVFHRSQRTTTELLELGVSQEDLDEHGGISNNLLLNFEAVARNPLAQLVTSSPADTNRDNEDAGPRDRHDYYETYPFLDVNGDGKAELRKICLLGPNKHVVSNEPANERPFAIFVPDPEPHTILGLSLFDYVADLQRISSFIFRGVLDSLSAHLNPRYEVVEDKVSIADVLNHELGAPIRVKEANVVRPLSIPFEGANALPILEYIQSIKESRVGPKAAGMNPEALQSATRAAVDESVLAAQQRIELFARIFAETGFKQLMKGLRRLVMEHQPRARMVRLRGKYVEVDPRSWNAARDVRVNVALGLGFTENKLAVLGVIAQQQEKWLEKLGPANPLVGLGQWRSTMARVLKLNGYPNADEFFKPLDPNFQPPPAPEPPPDPAMMVAQAEVQKTQAEMQRAEQEFALKQAEFQAQRDNDAAKLAQQALEAKMKDDLERDKLDADIQLRKAEIEARFNAEVNIAQIKADLDRDREHIKAASNERQTETAARIKAEAATTTP